MKIREFQNWLDDILDISSFKDTDASMNGMQVGRKSEEIQCIALAVDACAEVFRRAGDAGADAVLVHHGLFWGKPLAVTNEHYSRLSLLFEHDVALFAAHLPLDAHPEVGNNAAIAQALHIQNPNPFGWYHGQAIGISGALPRAVTVQELTASLGWEGEPDITVLPFGPEKLAKVGIVSGGAAKTVSEAIGEGLDAFITGESSHQIYHDCLEAGITVLAGGHYRTEVYGIQALGKLIEKETGIKTVFIDVPTGL